MIDLRPYTARGFPGGIDDALTKLAVAGIDLLQARSCVRFCPETEATIYGPEFSPTRIQYMKGARPKLEVIVAQFPRATLQERVAAAMHWVAQNVRHPFIKGPTVPNRAMSEEELIDSGIGWCNEQTRVFIALCETMEIPARLCFLFHANMISGHTTAEVFVSGRWAFVDVTFEIIVPLPDGRWAEARELSGPQRPLAHQAYRPALEALYRNMLPCFDDLVGWGKKTRPSVERGGDLMNMLAFCNYVIDGARAV